ncbi:NHLP family bacteriocin export ABC transporter peptidase/permease/ATPase subunit [Desulforamulus aeronauticus]|uniref:NHLM bacteriocin system ABC transporter, peptidase/ATP-binding protein n=1 Tax=Desulforamulus aeronauticus DSM 10349 TaxID=1121421 RepID=A0A1M6NUY9_9FIRM|nr:NHLM bacteriocin system ABC transporter, peptidase/ATP-binding protein [Desulforamulus aeronauticus DSM 10349]
MLARPKVKRVPAVLQMEAVECGAASLAMIFAYYKKYLPLEQMRVDCGVTRDGVKASNILKAARRYGFEAKGFRKEPQDLRTMPLPAIIHWNFNHFVVLEGFVKDQVYINDPGSGPKIISEEEFDLAFTGVILTFVPGAAFQPGGEKNSFIVSLRKWLSGSRSAILYLVIIGLLMVIPGLLVPAFSKIFIDDILLEGKGDWLKPLLWAMGVAAVVQGVLIALQQYYLLKMETKTAVSNAAKFFWHIFRLPVEFFQQRSAGDVANRMQSNDEVAGFLSRELAETAIGLLTIVFYFLVMLQFSVPLALISLLLAAVNIGYLLYSSNKIETLNAKLLQDRGKVMGFSISGLYIIETLKASASESDFFAKWSGYHAKEINSQQSLGKTTQILLQLPEFLSEFANVIILFVGGLTIISGHLTIGSLIAFQGLLASFMQPVNGLTQMGMRLKEVQGDINRLEDVFKYNLDENVIREAETEKEDDAYQRLAGFIEIKDLSFGYNPWDPPLIEHFSLSLNPGSRVALVGGSGSGKSTIAKLIAGIYRPWSGAILFDGKQRESLPRSVIVNSLAVVDQDITMFDGTIRENLTMWDSTISEFSLLRATKDACIHDDITLRDKGYDHKVSEGGANFSGGQRQRLEIARALAGNPAILILDEATSALDVHTEKLVDENIRRRGCTCVIVAHRLSTIRDCDEIIVLDRGKIAERGTHDELKNAGGLYAQLISA